VPPLPWIVVVFAGVLLVYLAFLAGKLLGQVTERAKHRADVPRIRQDSVKRSRAVVVGQVAEQLAPFLPEFPYSPSEARFIGKPIDFIVFEGMDEKEIRSVVFVEVKSGASRLSAQEKKLKDAIVNKRVTWCEYRLPARNAT